jgi:hypothetical protein
VLTSTAAQRIAAARRRENVREPMARNGLVKGWPEEPDALVQGCRVPGPHCHRGATGAGVGFSLTSRTIKSLADAPR